MVQVSDGKGLFTVSVEFSVSVSVTLISVLFDSILGFFVSNMFALLLK